MKSNTHKAKQHKTQKQTINKNSNIKHTKQTQNKNKTQTTEQHTHTHRCIYLTTISKHRQQTQNNQT